MAAQSAKTDKFVNLIAQTMTLSAANTLTFQEVNVGLNIFDKVGFLISKLEYEPASTSIAEMTAASDAINMGLSTSNNLSNLVPAQTEIVDVMTLMRHDMGAAASGALLVKTFTRDFSTLPGGGLLVPPKPLFLAGASAGLANAATIYYRIYFTMIRLSDSEYLELLETRRAFG